MRKRALLLWLAVAPGMIYALPPGPSQVVIRGTVSTNSGDHPAWLRLICAQGPGGALSLQLMLGTDSAPDFPFDAFEGPPAPASYQPSAQLQVGHQHFAPAAVGGWFSGDVDGAFVFGVVVVP